MNVLQIMKLYHIQIKTLRRTIIIKVLSGLTTCWWMAARKALILTQCEQKMSVNVSLRSEILIIVRFVNAEIQLLFGFFMSSCRPVGHPIWWVTGSSGTTHVVW